MTITRNDDIGGAILNCAVRYALGRMSYMPSLVINEIKPMLQGCSRKTLWCFEKDVRDFLNSTPGSMQYPVLWQDFLTDVNKEIRRREDEDLGRSRVD